MFDRASYDRTLYDRSSAFDSVEAAFRGTSKLNPGIEVRIYFEAFELGGGGGVHGSAAMRQETRAELSGEGAFGANDFRLFARMPSLLSGGGSIAFGISARTPFGAVLSGSGAAAISSALRIAQTMAGVVTGTGGLSATPTLRSYLSGLVEGKASLSVNNRLHLRLNLSPKIDGSGTLEPHRLGSLNTDELEFNNLNLASGQVLTIDSDELNVLVGNVLDVSSVTSESIFFNLQPGGNELTFTYNGNASLTVTFLWQNRWL
jgi:hypothetical protein